MANTRLNYLATTSDIEVGSIILFHAEPGRTFRTHPVQYLIMGLQKVLSWKSGGHYDTTHVAICVGKDDQGRPIFDEVTERRGVRGYFRDVFQQKNRSLMVFTPTSETMRQNLVDECNAVYEDEKRKRSRIWSVLAAVATFVNPAPLIYRIFGSKKTNEDRLSKQWLICSSNVITRRKSAAMKGNLTPEEIDAYYPDIPTESSPKKTEDELRRKQAHYRVGVYTASEDRGGPYQAIKQEMKKQIDRLYMKETGDESLDPGQRREYMRTHPHVKSTTCYHEYEKLTSAVEKSNLNELEKALYLLKHMTDYLKYNTGLGFKTAKAYSSVMSVATEMGIHEIDVKQSDIKIESEKVRRKEEVWVPEAVKYSSPPKASPKTESGVEVWTPKSVKHYTRK